MVVPGLQSLLVTGKLIIFPRKAAKVKIDGEEEIKGAEKDNFCDSKQTHLLLLLSSIAVAQANFECFCPPKILC